MSEDFIKDPNAILDFTFDWTDWLASGETISSHTTTVDTGITEESNSESSGIVTVWLSGGTPSSVYNIACKIVTSASRTDERTFTVKTVNR